MSSLRTYLAATLTLLSFVQTPAHAGIYGDPLPFFASCTGRLSAELEFQWLVSDPATAAQVKAQRAALIDILDALTPTEGAQTVLHQRISAKMAHAALLTTARFHTDPDRARAAAERAERLTRGCTDQLLS
ncbi:MAG: hypothetical protein AAFY65_12835 [Pseudomonadota bacterium]